MTVNIIYSAMDCAICISQFFAIAKKEKFQ